MEVPVTAAKTYHEDVIISDRRRPVTIHPAPLITIDPRRRSPSLPLHECGGPRQARGEHVRGNMEAAGADTRS